MGGGTSHYQHSSTSSSSATVGPAGGTTLAFPFIRSRASISPLPTSQQLHEDLQIDYLLGQGGYSQVYHGISLSNPQHQLAIKIVNLRKFLSFPSTSASPHSVVSFFPPSPSSSSHPSTPVSTSLKKGISASDLDSLKTILNELKVFQAIEGLPFIVTLHSAFRYSMNCYFVMECLSGGDLRNLLRRHGRLNEPTVAYLVGCIGSALHHIHERGVIHRDIKPENIGINALGRPCLTDFGISMVATVDNPVPLNTNSSGTLPYLAPEVLGPGHCHSYQADYWSLGVMAYELLFKDRPMHRHCSLHSIHFVANEYGWMWSDLLRRSRHHRFSSPSSSSSSSRGKEAFGQETLSPFVNFEAMSRPDDWVIPFPDCRLRCSDDGRPPPCLVTIAENPEVSFGSTLECSAEMRDLLNGLMDVRIPLRLGSLSRYCAEFESHPCFKKYGYDLPRLPRMESQLVNSSFHFPQPAARLSSSSHFRDLFIDEVEDPNLVERMLQPLTPSLRNQFLHFYHFKTVTASSSSSSSHPLPLNLPRVNATLEVGDSPSTTSRLTGRS